MRIVWAQLYFQIGNLSDNALKIIEAIEQAQHNKADLIVFPELALCGYSPLDLLEQHSFIEKCKKELDKIAAHCTQIAAIVGAPLVNNSLAGKKLFNAAFFMQHQKIERVIKKTLLPDYDVFDECRYFEPNKNFELLELKNKKIALTICEDIWDSYEANVYSINPLQELIKQQPDFVINIAASPFHYRQYHHRNLIIKNKVLEYKIPFIYVNHCGAHAELIFDGGSRAFDAEGNLIAASPFFKEDIQYIDLFDKRVKPIETTDPDKYQLIYDALVCGIKDFFEKQQFKKAVLGLSGGVDSALVLCLAVAALGKENVYAVLLPSPYSTEHSISDSLELVKNLSCPHTIIPIENSFNEILSTLEPSFKNTVFNVAEENIQARLRGLILMALSNKFNYILLNTSNKSEIAVGYGTLYGDMCGSLAVIGDLYKTEVYNLCQYINRNKEIIPQNILTKAPSAELRPGQKDSDSLPDYALLDKILNYYIEQGCSSEEIIAKGYQHETVLIILNMVQRNEYKRRQAAPILRVSSKAFGLGRKMPLVAKIK